MKTVLVTGAKGFIGRNLISHLNLHTDMRIFAYDLDVDAAVLPDMVTQADVVVHLAGVNRPQSETEFVTGNLDFTNQLLGLLTKNRRFVPVLLSSSTQAELENAYGKSKRAAEDAVLAWGAQYNTDVYVYRLPNVFGKWCRPNYNSAVATFCYNIARDLHIQVNDPSRLLTLAYIDDVVNEFIHALQGQPHRSTDGYCAVPQVYSITLADLVEKIRSFHAIKDSLVLPDFADALTHHLHATYISYLPDTAMSYKLGMKHDNRGWLSELIKSPHFGQMFISRTLPGITRGNHWHHTKVEKFMVVSGKAKVCLRKIDDTQVYEFLASGDCLQVVEIPPGYTHSIKNIGDDDVMTLFWANEIFDPSKSDTYLAEV